MTKEFKVNEYLTLRLIRDETVLYVKNARFLQCKFLLLNIPVDKVSSFDEIESVDAAAEKLDTSLEPIEGRVRTIPPEVEFWGHCSNLQVWAEHGYDTRLLHRNLAFPLLKKLSEVGDPMAKRVFKDEIIKRIKEGNAKVFAYLINERYLEIFTDEEFRNLILDAEFRFIDKILNIINDPTLESSDEITTFTIDILDLILEDFELLKTLFLEQKEDFIKKLLELQNYLLSVGAYEYSDEIIIRFLDKLKDNDDATLETLHSSIFNLFFSGSNIILFELIFNELFEFLREQDFLTLFNHPNSKFKENIIKISKNNAKRYNTNRGSLCQRLITILVVLCKKIGKGSVVHFLGGMEEEAKSKLLKCLKNELIYIKDKKSEYYLDKKELERYIQEFIKILEDY